MFVSKWGTLGTGDGQFNYPLGVSVASDGSVYVADAFNHRIQKFTPEGEFISQWGTYGTGDGNFHEPRGIAAGSDDTVYISDYGNNRIKKFTVDRP